MYICIFVCVVLHAVSTSGNRKCQNIIDYRELSACNGAHIPNMESPPPVRVWHVSLQYYDDGIHGSCYVSSLCKTVNDSRYYRALESVSTASDLSSAYYLPMSDLSPSNADSLNSNFLQLGRRSSGLPQRTVYPRRLPAMYKIIFCDILC